jgi:hypothetical protein
MEHAGCHQLDVSCLQNNVARSANPTADAILPPPLGAVQHLQGGDDEREGLAATRLGRAQDVSTRERVRDGGALNRRELLEAPIYQAALGGGRKRHVLELTHADQGPVEAFLARLARRHG